MDDGAGMTSGKQKEEEDNSVDFGDPALDVLDDQDGNGSVDTDFLEKHLTRKDEARKASCGNAKPRKTSLTCHQRNCSHLLLRRQTSSLMRPATKNLRQGKQSRVIAPVIDDFF